MSQKKKLQSTKYDIIEKQRNLNNLADKIIEETRNEYDISMYDFLSLLETMKSRALRQKKL